MANTQQVRKINKLTVAFIVIFGTAFTFALGLGIASLVSKANAVNVSPNSSSSSSAYSYSSSSRNTYSIPFRANDLSSWTSGVLALTVDFPTHRPAGISSYIADKSASGKIEEYAYFNYSDGIIGTLDINPKSVEDEIKLGYTLVSQRTVSTRTKQKLSLELFYQTDKLSLPQYVVRATYNTKGETSDNYSLLLTITKFDETSRGVDLAVSYLTDLISNITINNE